MHSTSVFLLPLTFFSPFLFSIVVLFCTKKHYHTQKRNLKVPNCKLRAWPQAKVLRKVVKLYDVFYKVKPLC